MGNIRKESADQDLVKGFGHEEEEIVNHEVLAILSIIAALTQKGTVNN